MTEQERKDANVVRAVQDCGKGNCFACNYDEYTDCKKALITDLAGVIDRKDKRIEELEERIAIMAEGQEWILPGDAMPEANKAVLVHRGKWVTMLVYTRRKVRGKIVERWEYENGGIYHDRVDGWMPLPKAPIEGVKE